MSRYHRLQVAQVHRETDECVSVWLDVPQELKDKFVFKPGQYLNLRTQINGEEVRKSYSIHSTPDDPYLKVAVKWVYKGIFSTYANQDLKAGDWLEVMSPEGKFVLPDDLPEDAVLVFFTAGSGITPVMSIVQHFLHHFPKGQAILFYSNKTSDSIIFRDELEALKNQYMTRFSIYPVMTREVTGVDILSGRIDKEKVREFARHFFSMDEISGCYICGPELMIHDVKDTLKELGLPESKIKYELFGTFQHPAAERPKEEKESVGENIISRVTVRCDGHEQDFSIGYLDEPVLDVAMRGGLDLPYSCKGGVCTTCRAVIVEGDVHMDIQYGLEPDEIDAGYVLTCQAHPRSERLILDFDIL